MPRWEHVRENRAATQPRSLWEAVTMLARVQEEQEIAARLGEVSRGAALDHEQALAWAYLRGFAENLVARGEAPPGMVARLRTALKLEGSAAEFLGEIGFAAAGEELAEAA